MNGRMEIGLCVLWIVVWSGVCWGYSGGSGTIDDPYQINTLMDLLELAGQSSDYDKAFILTADLDLSRLYQSDHHKHLQTKALIAPDGIHAFTGVFDGAGHAIDGLTIDAFYRSNDYLGFIGRLGAGGQVGNLHLRNVMIEGTYSFLVGGLAGVNDGATITGCSVTGQIQGSDGVGGLIGLNRGPLRQCQTDITVRGGDDVGGLIGENSGSLQDCSSRGRIQGNHSVGGLVGTQSYGEMQQCFSQATVSGGQVTGGLVGYNGIAIERCYASGQTLATYDVGGLVGYNAGTIRDCYVSGNVKGTDGAGGLVGFQRNGSLLDCYTSGTVQGPSNIGIVMGAQHNGSVSHCYAILDDYFQPQDWPDNGYGTRLTLQAARRSESYAQWDFETTWKMEFGDYPSLNWQQDVVTVPDVTGLTLEDAQETMLAIGLTLSGVATPYQDNTDSQRQVALHSPEPGSTVVWGRGLNVRIQAYSGGNGLSADDPYLISRYQDLMDYRAVDRDKFFCLTTDIDMDPNVPGQQTLRFPVWGGYQEQAFAGRFEGAGYRIKHLHLLNATHQTGLFGWVSPEGIIQNLGVENASIEGVDLDTAGLIVGRHRGTLINCYASGRINGMIRLGGLAGFIEQGTIQTSYATVQITGQVSLGGLAGECYQGSIRDSYAMGCLDASGPWPENQWNGQVGGVVGGAGQCTLSHCYSTAQVKGPGETGGIVGGADDVTVIEQCYYLKWLGINNGYGTALTCTKMTDTLSFEGWDWNATWQALPGDYPSLQWQTQSTIVPEIIGLDMPDAENTLKAASLDASGHIPVYRDDIPAGVVLDQYPLRDIEVVAGRGVALWISAGPSPYQGGDGLSEESAYEIVSSEMFKALMEHPEDWNRSIRLETDLNLAPNILQRGAFHEALLGTEHTRIFTGIFDGNGHTLRYLSLENDVGEGDLALFGHIGHDGHVKNLTLDDLTVISGSDGVAGLALKNDGRVSHCHIRGNIFGDDEIAGLVVRNGGTVTGCSVLGDIIGDEDTGGAVAYNEGVIDRCRVEGNITCHEDVGGLVDYNQGTITNSYMVGQVDGGDGAGGLVRFNADDGTIRHCYVASTVAGCEKTGAFTGTNRGIIEGCFWDATIAGISNSAGGIGLTTPAMQSLTTYLDAGWDFVDESQNGDDDIWRLPEAGYPVLAQP